LNTGSFTDRFVFGMTLAVFCLFVLVSCARSANSTLAPATVGSQLTAGAPIYTQTCATSSCHGTQGQGIRSGSNFSAWPLVGAEFQARNPNAQVIFDVVRSGDEPNLRALTDQQIYDAIAYELNQNQIQMESPLTAANATLVFGGAMSGSAFNGLYPPVADVVIAGASPVRSLPLAAQNGRLSLQLDQLAQASAIGNARPAAGSSFVMMVIELTDLTEAPISVSPDYFKLSTPGGDSLLPQSIEPHSAIEAFHPRTISPQHGVTALIIFSFPASQQFNQLIYNDQVGNPLTLDLTH
jgi:mono/diheme cytochrome c family protein